MKENLEKFITEAEEKLAQIKVDAAKFTEKSNKAAGTRVRTGAMDLIKIMKSVRNEVQEIKNKS